MKYIFRFEIEGGIEFGIEIDGVGVIHNGVLSAHDVYTDKEIADQALDVMRLPPNLGGMGAKVVMSLLDPKAPFRPGNATDFKDFVARVNARKEHGMRIRKIFDGELEVREIQDNRDKH